MKFIKKEIDLIGLPDFPNMNEEAGKEHYKLLNYLAGEFTKVGKINFFDVGTYKGYSALALSFRYLSKVTSYDIQDQLGDLRRDRWTDYIIGNVLDDPDLLKADLILLDTNHDGLFENKFYEFIRRDFKGWLLLDDIHLNDQMRNFWDSITEKKYDLTAVGHYTGTGLVVF